MKATDEEGFGIDQPGNARASIDMEKIKPIFLRRLGQVSASSETGIPVAALSGRIRSDNRRILLNYGKVDETSGLPIKNIDIEDAIDIVFQKYAA